MNISKAEYDKLIHQLDFYNERAEEWETRADELQDSLKKVYKALHGQPLADTRNGGHYMDMALSSAKPKKLSTEERAEIRERELWDRIVDGSERIRAAATVIECSGALPQ